MACVVFIAYALGCSHGRDYQRRSQGNDRQRNQTTKPSLLRFNPRLLRK